MALSDEIVVILAGGEGRRMDYADKAGLLIDGERLIDRLVRQISRQTTHIIISAKQDYGLGLPFISDAEEGIKGPVAGLYAVSDWMKKNRPFARGFFTVPVDCPDLPEDVFARLHSLHQSCVACDERGLHPVFAWWQLKDLLKQQSKLEAKSSVSLHHIAELIRAAHIKWSGDEHFGNINTPDQLEKYQNL